MPNLKRTTLSPAAFALAALLLALNLVGCAQQSAAPMSNLGWPSPNLPPTGAPPVTMSVIFCQDSGTACAPSSTFSLKALRDLNVIVQWRNLPQGMHLQTLNVLLPDGGIYQTYESTFEVTDSTGDTITVAKPVRFVGTWATQRNVVGNWQAQVSLDGELMGTQEVHLSR